MKVLFLDIDGVLNSVGSAIYHNRNYCAGKFEESSLLKLDPICCSNLLYILEEVPDLKIVVSSTWRKYKELLSDFNRILDDLGINTYEKVTGTTPVSEDGYRGYEIDSYLKDHPEIKDFVILDDDSDMEPHMNRLVKTDSRNGLTFADAEKVIEMFGETK